jgi:hypothetical protein
MAEYDNTNRGALFKNDDKQEPGHSDYNGSINVDGVEYWLNAWIKDAKSGRKFMSLSVKPKAKPEPKPEPKGMEAIQGMDNDIPFSNPYKGRLSYVV